MTGDDSTVIDPGDVGLAPLSALTSHDLHQLSGGCAATPGGRTCFTPGFLNLDLSPPKYFSGEMNCPDCGSEMVVQKRRPGYCRRCYGVNWRRNHPEKVKMWSRFHHQMNKLSGKAAEKDRARQIKDRVKLNCRSRLRMAVKSGRIKRLPCVKCGAEPSHGHHEDYSKPFDVIWLCRPCHDEIHARAQRVLPTKQTIIRLPFLSLTP